MAHLNLIQQKESSFPMTDRRLFPPAERAACPRTAFPHERSTRSCFSSQRPSRDAIQKTPLLKRPLHPILSKVSAWKMQPFPVGKRARWPGSSARNQKINKLKKKTSLNTRLRGVKEVNLHWGWMGGGCWEEATNSCQAHCPQPLTHKVKRAPTKQKRLFERLSESLRWVVRVNETRRVCTCVCACGHQNGYQATGEGFHNVIVSNFGILRGNIKSLSQMTNNN